jgi:hypothetical protein
MDDMRLDGNAIAGVLSQVFTAEMTTAIAKCGHCGASEMLGALHAYQGAGVVLRCPQCDDALVKVVWGDARVWISFAGVQTLDIALGTR